MSALTEQLNAKVPEGTADLARRAAADRGVPLGTYLATLITDDTSGARARFRSVAHTVIADHGDLMDELEEASLTETGEAEAAE